MHSASGALDIDADLLPRLTAVEELRIGSVDDPDVGFTRIGGVDVDRDGQVYVVESAGVQIRVYSPQGERLQTIGRRGEGRASSSAPPSSGSLATRSGRWKRGPSPGSPCSTARATSWRQGATTGVAVPIQDGFNAVVMPAALGSDGLFVGSVAFAFRDPAAPPATGARPWGAPRLRPWFGWAGQAWRYRSPRAASSCSRYRTVAPSWSARSRPWQETAL